MSDREQIEAPLAAIYILGRQDRVWNVRRELRDCLGKNRERPEAELVTCDYVIYPKTPQPDVQESFFDDNPRNPIVLSSHHLHPDPTSVWRPWVKQRSYRDLVLADGRHRRSHGHKLY